MRISISKAMWLKVSLLVLCLAVGLSAQDVAAIAQKTEALYARAGSFSAEFVQEVATGGFFENEKTGGLLLMEYPHKFRIDTPEQVIACDGDTIWSYSVENRQVTIEAVDRLEELVTPADYLFNFQENYRIEYGDATAIAGVAVHQLQLTARDRNKYVQSMELFIRSDDFSVMRVRYTDINDNVITIDFSQLQLGAEIPPERFRFKTPKGIEEVRLP